MTEKEIRKVIKNLDKSIKSIEDGQNKLLFQMLKFVRHSEGGS